MCDRLTTEIVALAAGWSNNVAAARAALDASKAAVMEADHLTAAAPRAPPCKASVSCHTTAAVGMKR
jgi:hypothetical protein